MAETVHCNTCNLDYKNKQSHKKHLNTSRHKERSTNANIVVFTCICEKSYSYNQSLRLHQKTCKLYQTSDQEPNPPDNVAISSYVQQLRIENNDLRKRIESFQHELIELRAQVERIHVKNIEKDHKRIKPVHRTKINKDTRNLVANKQEHTCGRCKLELSPYFQLDHIIGLQFGGTNEESNLMALCCECHAIKSIRENQRRKQIKDAILNIIKEEIPV